MGTLKPGATYIYEKVDGVTYAREFGAHPSTRQAIGWDYDSDRHSDGILDRRSRMQNDQLWHDIRRAAHSNPALQKALEQCILIYHLSKENAEH